MCQVWLTLSQWFWRDHQCILFCYCLPLEKVWPFIWTNFLILFTRPANIFWSFSNHMGYLNYISHFQWPRVKSMCPHLLNRRPHPFPSLFFYMSWFMSFFHVTQGFDNFWSFQATQRYDIVVSIQVAHSCSNWRDSRLWRLSPNLSDPRLWQPWHCSTLYTQHWQTWQYISEVPVSLCHLYCQLLKKL